MPVDVNGDFFDGIDRLRFTPTAKRKRSGVLPAKRGARASTIKGEFLKGPIPLTWLSSAAALSGKGPLAVGLAIWFEAGRRRSREVTLTNAILERFGVTRKTKYRGLNALEEAGLIVLDRRPRRNPVVTIIDTDKATSTDSVDRDVSGGDRAGGGQSRT